MSPGLAARRPAGSLRLAAGLAFFGDFPDLRLLFEFFRRFHARSDSQLRIERESAHGFKVGDRSRGEEKRIVAVAVAVKIEVRLDRTGSAVDALHSHAFT